MAAPVYFTMSLLGGLAGYFARGRAQYTTGSRRLAVAALLSAPLLSAALESGLPSQAQTRLVTSSVRIAAPAALVWQHIARVPPITEPQSSLFFSMGFPRPIEATLSHEGVGGVRHARFERGLYFIETVTLWDPPRSIRFAIEPDPGQTPLTTLDEHVLVGGRYFDVLEGSYRIEAIESGAVLLHLISEHKINTHFNAYTALWSDYLMSEIQRNILLVIKQRAERAAPAAGGPPAGYRASSHPRLGRPPFRDSHGWGSPPRGPAPRDWRAACPSPRRLHPLARRSGCQTKKTCFPM